jgi:hypothetical protein
MEGGGIFFHLNVLIIAVMFCEDRKQGSGGIIFFHH